jgi:hypothetical protein
MRGNNMETVAKIWKVLSLYVLPVLVFLCPIPIAILTHRDWVFWFLLISWLPSIIGIVVMSAVQIVNGKEETDEDIMEREYRRIHSTEQNITTP